MQCGFKYTHVTIIVVVVLLEKYIVCNRTYACMHACIIYLSDNDDNDNDEFTPMVNI